jgi:hypothetical protein
MIPSFFLSLPIAARSAIQVDNNATGGSNFINILIIVEVILFIGSLASGGNRR